jgi:glutamine cyclotransferase
MAGTMLFRAALAAGLLLYIISPTLSAEQPPQQEIPQNPAPVIRYTLENTYPHDSAAFTQGLVFHDGFIYEGTGIRGKSELRRVDLPTGKILKRHALPESLFGEGVTIWGDSLIQLTWRSKTAIIYNRKDFSISGSFHYATEGWGITNDGKALIMSDGTELLYFLDPETYSVSSTLRVVDAGLPVRSLNELEYVKGRIYANVWRTNRIAVINPVTGSVTAWIDLSMLAERAGGDRRVKTLNGIAYDNKLDRLFVTGKLWPSIYEIKTDPVP